MAPAALAGDFMPVLLYAAVLLGFVIAGLGLLGVRPMVPATRYLLVLAPALSLVALQRLGHRDLWFGMAIDVVLLLVGLTAAYARLPEAQTHHGWTRRALGAACAFGFLAYVACAAAMWPWHRAWGSTLAEHAIALPGDRPDRNPALEIQHAVTIDAPPAAVWPWLVQLGQDRAGFYSYDWLERAFGVHVHNVAEIRPEWQLREVGDLLRATQRDYLGGLLGPDLGWKVKAVEPERALVLEHWGAFALVPTADGKTRFIIRTTIGHERIPAWAAALDIMTFQLPHFIMERRMMLRIKELAETRRPTAIARSSDGPLLTRPTSRTRAPN
jgi:uncharacterized protein YndB with AHSA1/START domain